MSKIYDDLRAAVERYHEAGRCKVRWRNDARTALNALQRFAPDIPDLVELEAACERYRKSAPASPAVRAKYSGRVQAAINLHRGVPTERWPGGAQALVRLEIRIPAELRDGVLALAAERGCTAREVVMAAIQDELHRAAQGRAQTTPRNKTARIS